MEAKERVDDVADITENSFFRGLLFLLPVLGALLPQCSSHLIFNDPN